MNEIPGTEPIELPENSRSAWYSYAFRYDAAQFNGLPRSKFMRAMQAEGVPCSAGYSEQYFDGAIDEAIGSRGFQRLFSPQRLKAYRDSLHELKGNKQACETAVMMYQTVLLVERSGVDHILEAVRKIHAHSAELAKRA